MASKPRFAANNNDEYLPSPLLAADGNPYFKRVATKADKANPNLGGTGGDGEGGGAMTEIGKLQTHIRWIERGMIALGVCLLSFAGVTWSGYVGLISQVTTLAIGQKEASGKIDTLDAKISGKLDLLGQRFDDNVEAGKGSGKTR